MIIDSVGKFERLFSVLKKEFGVIPKNITIRSDVLLNVGKNSIPGIPKDDTSICSVVISGIKIIRDD